MTDEKLLQEVRARAMGMGFSARWLILELAGRYERLKEPKMLKIYPARGSGKSGPLVRALRDLDSARAEAIKEFAERLKFEFEIAFDEPIFEAIIGEIIKSTIDKLLKELTEPTKIEHNSLCETETYESR